MFLVETERWSLGSLGLPEHPIPAPVECAARIHPLGLLPQFRTKPPFWRLFRLTLRGAAPLNSRQWPCANS